MGAKVGNSCGVGEGGLSVEVGKDGIGVISWTGLLVGVVEGLRVGFLVGVTVGVFKDEKSTRREGVGLGTRSNGTKRPCPA